MPCHIRPLTTEQSFCIHCWTRQFVLHTDTRVISSAQNPQWHSLLKISNDLALVSSPALSLALLVPGQPLQGFLSIPRTQPASSHPEAFASTVLFFRYAVSHIPQTFRELIPTHPSHLSSIPLPQESLSKLHVILLQTRSPFSVTPFPSTQYLSCLAPSKIYYNIFTWLFK